MPLWLTSKKDYAAKPKRVRQENRGKRPSIDALVESCIDAGCNDALTIKQFLIQSKRDGKLPFSVYSKISLKKLISYVSESFDDT